MNNLENLIKKAGYTKKEFADMNGITPATLSRHMHGKIPMTVKDAEKYGKLLDCHARAVLFPLERVPIFMQRWVSEKDGKTITEHKILTPTTEAIEIPAFYSDDMIAMEWLVDKNYNGEYLFFNKTINLYPRFPVQQEFIDCACYQNQALCRLEEPVLAHGVLQDIVTGQVYPQPNGLYTIHSEMCALNLEKVKLKWATPLVQMLIRPDLRGVQRIYM
jgi:transcriptional regulator with XRE-family HTH domain